MNIYCHKFIAKCPNNGVLIKYRLRIKASFMIQVEHIILACQLHADGYHETIAAGLHKRFGGQVRLSGHHHGVDIVTTLGDPLSRAEPIKFVSTVGQ